MLLLTRLAIFGNRVADMCINYHHCRMTKVGRNQNAMFPADATVREVAKQIYAGVKSLPIISPHGHVPPQWLADDISFADPTSLLITPDHYLTRVLHSAGVSLSQLGVAQSDFSVTQAREAFRIFCSHWALYRGTPTRFWFESELQDVFDIDLEPSAETADAIYDAIDAALKTPEFTARALYKRFQIEFLATTDDPCDSLEYHQQLAADPSWEGKVAPTFRPDKYLEPAQPQWNGLVDRLGEVTGIDTDSWSGWVAAMENRRAYFKTNGAVSSDHSHRDARAEPLPPTEANELYRQARAGVISAEDALRLRRAFVFEQARMAADDGLVMTIHPAVWRNHSQPTFEKYGADVGGDIPMSVEFTDATQPMLSAFGLAENFQVVFFTMDETVYSRELAPLAGFYPSVYVGVPWWFIDAPDAMARFRAGVTEAAGFSRTSGFIDDTRAYLSIPARHDLARRIDSGYLARLVCENRLTETEAHEVAQQLVVENPRKAFKL